MSAGAKSSHGALPRERLQELLSKGAIEGAQEHNIQPASLDVTLSDEVYRVERLFLPTTREAVRDLLPHIGAQRHNLSTPMERGVTYLARLNETFALPRDVYGYCNPKSSTGRNDLHVRVVADGMARYDAFAVGFSGEAWIAIRALSYPVRMPTGFALSQVRLFDADRRLSRQELEVQYKQDPLLYNASDTPLPFEEHGVFHHGSLTLTIDLSGEVAGFECLEPSTVLDLSCVGTQDAARFFRPMTHSSDSIVLREGRFYILSTCERVRVPPHLACEMRPMDERYGDFRAHYAGFIDPGWGWGEAGEGTGRTLTLEVRPFENLEVRHRQIIARIRFEHMAAQPGIAYDAAGSNYTKQQGPKLAKQFIS